MVKALSLTSCFFPEIVLKLASELCSVYGQSRPTPRLVINVDHRIVGIISFVLVLVNPLAATPLFSPSSLARAALFGLVVYIPRGRTVAPAPDSPKGPVRQCTIGTSPFSIRWWILEACIPSSPVTVSAQTCQQWQVPLWSWILQTWRVE
jgi:hypothetical protein